MRSRSITLLLLSVLAFFGLAGCFNLKAKPDVVRFFSLGPIETSADQSSSNKNGPLVYIERPEVPGYAAGENISIRDANGEITFLQNVRWAEILAEGTARGIGEWLTETSGMRISGFYPWPKIDSSALSLKLQFHQFHATEDGVVIVRADWEIRGEDNSLARGTYRSDGITWTPQQPETLLAGFNLAIERLAGIVANEF